MTQGGAFNLSDAWQAKIGGAHGLFAHSARLFDSFHWSIT